MPDEDHYGNRERLTGTGYIYSRSRKVCCAEYEIETFLDASTSIPNDPHVIEFLKEIHGNIRPLDLPIHSLFGNDDLTLSIEDGRKLDFFITETITGTITPKAGFRV